MLRLGRREFDENPVGRHHVVAARREPGAGDAVAEGDGDDAVGGALRRVHTGVGGLAVEGATSRQRTPSTRFARVERAPEGVVERT